MIENPKIKHCSLINKDVTITTEYMLIDNKLSDKIGGLKQFCSEINCEYYKKGKCNLNIK